MSNLTVNQNVPALVMNSVSARPAAEKTQTETVNKSSALANDVVKIQKGLVPSLKGAGAGALAGGLIAGVPLALVAAGSSGSGSGGALIVAVAGAAGGAAFGAVSGAVAANSTQSKGLGALIGAATGAATGALIMTGLGLKSGRIEAAPILITAALGAVAGAASGYSGAAIAKQE